MLGLTLARTREVHDEDEEQEHAAEDGQQREDREDREGPGEDEAEDGKDQEGQQGMTTPFAPTSAVDGVRINIGSQGGEPRLEISISSGDRVSPINDQGRVNGGVAGFMRANIEQTAQERGYFIDFQGKQHSV